MATVWEEFGVEVAKARAARKWTLEAVAEVAFGNKDRKGYVSQIEKGRTRLNKTTVEKLAKALDLADAVTDPLYRAHLPEENKLDTDARRLMTMASADKTAPVAADALMIGLAYEYAQGSHIDLQTAYAGLKGALQAAADMRAELDRLHNMDDRLTAVLRRVADLNDQGLRKEAGEALDAAIKAKEAELEALQDAALKQDRLLNRPAEAAQRLIARLRASAPAGGLFAATQRLIQETLERGKQQGDPFDLLLALDLAKANHSRAKARHLPFALTDLGNCHYALGERQAGGGHLTRARNAHTEALRLTSRQRDLQGWASSQNNLGNALQSLGDRSADPALLEQAIAAHRAALTVWTPEATPMDWATSQNNLGTALRALGERTADPAILEQAVAAHRAALTVWTPEATPMDWAMSQNNLGNALQALGERTADPALLEQAIAAHRAALTVRTPEATSMDWAGSQNNLGVALHTLGERTTDPAVLEQAIAAHRAALIVRTPEAMPMDWATSQNNLGLSLRWLATVTRNTALMAEAAAAYDACLTRHTRDDAPFLWAKTQWNLADLALARHALAPDPAHLATGQAYLDLAKEVFAQEGNDHQLAECDRLQALIDAA